MNKKSVILRILAALTVFALILCAGGCGSVDNTEEKSSKASQTESGGKTDTSSEAEKPFTSAEISDLKAEKIDYYYSADMDYSCFVACVDGKYGTMDDKGVMIADPVLQKPYFSMVYYSEDAKPDESILKWVLWCENGDGMILLNRDGGLKDCHQIPTGFPGENNVYWMSGKPVLVPYGVEPGTVECTLDAYYDYEAYFFRNTAYMNYSGGVKPKVIAIREVTSFKKEDNMGNEEYVPVFKSEKYGLFSFDKNEMLTDFIYDECVGPIDGVFAVRKGDKWGYVTESGKKLTDLVYDVANVHVDEYDAQYNYNEMYLPVNGYIVTVKNGKYGMIDTDGKTVLENRYGYISQVSGNGVFFMLEGGVWNRCVMK